nr:flagellar motor switch protein FliG [Treponema sp.]
MNLNDYRLNAYKNASKKDSDNISGSNENNINHNKNNQDEFLGRTVRRFNPEKLRYSSSEDDYSPVKHSQSVQRSSKDYLAEEAAASASLRQTADKLASGGLLKVPSSSAPHSNKAGNKESIYRRVAKFLLIIGVDEAAKILPHLSEEQTERIIPEIASIRQIDPDESAAILAEFQSLVQQARQNGGVDTA